MNLTSAVSGAGSPKRALSEKDGARVTRGAPSLEVALRRATPSMAIRSPAIRMVLRARFIQLDYSINLTLAFAEASVKARRRIVDSGGFPRPRTPRARARARPAMAA